MKKWIFVVLGSVNGVFASDNLHVQLILKMQELESASSEEARDRIREEVKTLKSKLSTASQGQSSLSPNQAAGTPIGSTNTNRDLYRTTYFYRGPVINPTNNTPFLNTSWQRGYGTDSYLLEGAPVFSLNHPNAYVNEVPAVGKEPRRNPYLNPFINPVTSQPGNFYQPGTNFISPNQYWQQQTPWANSAPHPYYWNQNVINQGYSQAYTQNPVHQTQQASSTASYDAIARFSHELQNSVSQVGGNTMNVKIESMKHLNNGQIEIIVRSGGGITGQGRYQQRIFLYNSSGQFIRQTDQPSSIAPNTQAGNLKNYNLSNQQRFQIDRWCAERGLNQYGDPLGTMYAGGNPMFNLSTTISDPQNSQDLRFSYILGKHPELIQLFSIQAK